MMKTLDIEQVTEVVGGRFELIDPPLTGLPPVTLPIVLPPVDILPVEPPCCSNMT
jgi:hypothetical protein